jgi:histidyl-tRNA synthetase
MAGGRYDGLIGMMGGPETPAVGFGGGIERLMALHDANIEDKRPVAIIPIGEKAENEAVVLASVLRGEGFYIELGYKGNVKKRMQKANGMNAVAGIIFGDDEIAAGRVKLKDFDSGAEVEVTAANLSDVLGKYRV